MKKLTEEKRMSVRIPYASPTSYRAMGSLVCPPSAVDVQGEILDISDGGLRIRVDGQAIEPGTILCIRVPVNAKSKSKTSITFPVLAEVRWVRKAALKDRQVGVRFIV